MKSQKPKQKRKQSKPELTEAELKKLLLKAGFVLINKSKHVFGKPESELNKDTLIFPEGSNKGILVK